VDVHSCGFPRQAGRLLLGYQFAAKNNAQKTK